MQSKYNKQASLALELLSNAITQIINTHYAGPAKNIEHTRQSHLHGRIRTREEKIWLGIYLTISKKYYRDKLLFKSFANPDQEYQDFKSSVAGLRTHKVSKEAKLYVEEVLLKRLQLVNKLGDQPTAMHQLLLCYLKQSCIDAWEGSSISRSVGQVEKNADLFFQRIASKLKLQRDCLSNIYSEVSKRRIAEFGPYCLMVKNNTAYVAEELTLADVFAVLPYPIKRQDPIRRDKGKGEFNSAERLKRVLESLNARYGHLVSCGMSPEIWLSQYDEQQQADKVKRLKFSDQQLRELEDLLHAVKQKRQEQEQYGLTTYSDEKQLFKNMFMQLSAIPKKNAAKASNKFAGFENADDCYQFYCAFIKSSYKGTDATHHCEEIAENSHKDFSSSTALYASIESSFISEATFASTVPEDSVGSELMAMPVHYPEDFNAVTAYAWRLFMLDDQVGLHASKAHCLLKDNLFREMIAQNPQLGYVNLSDQRLLKRLREELAAIVLKHISGNQHD